MKVIVDTSVWSLVFRRTEAPRSIFADLLLDLITDERVVLMGAIRQEILSGIKYQEQYEALKLRAFPDLTIDSYHYERAAQYYNDCRKKGLQGSNTDFLICACSNIFNYPILTTDKDFSYLSKTLDIKLFEYK